ncbi:hypothetical protein L195_g028268 [Trifolium pratense]|uniref:Cytochrome p450 n=1 Tax=Trifolium pratense TaxID=57577 RepID=A0A2K3L1H8_TRIPR|nr:hypothetical protein L195_g028268 [Trifolium pratense]
MQHASFANMFSILSILSQEQQCIFAVTCWSIWRSRNATIWENTRERAAEIVQQGNCWRNGEQFEMVQCSARINRNRMLICINGSVRREVLRDEFGMYMGAKTMWFQPLMDVRIGEAVGSRSAIEWKYWNLSRTANRDWEKN